IVAPLEARQAAVLVRAIGALRDAGVGLLVDIVRAHRQRRELGRGAAAPGDGLLVVGRVVPRPLGDPVVAGRAPGIGGLVFGDVGDRAAELQAVDLRLRDRRYPAGFDDRR